MFLERTGEVVGFRWRFWKKMFFFFWLWIAFRVSSFSREPWYDFQVGQIRSVSKWLATAKQERVYIMDTDRLWNEWKRRMYVCTRTPFKFAARDDRNISHEDSDLQSLVPWLSKPKVHNARSKAFTFNRGWTSKASTSSSVVGQLIVKLAECLARFPFTPSWFRWNFDMPNSRGRNKCVKRADPKKNAWIVFTF